MKANKIFAIAMAALALVACDKKEGEVEKVELNQKTLQLEVGQEATLVATVTPEGAAAVAWSVDDIAIATVSDQGVVKGIAQGQTIVTATAGNKSARCIVKVGASGPSGNAFAHLLTGSNYYVLNLGTTAFEAIQSKVVEDLRINGEYVEQEIPATVTCVFEVWGKTFGDGVGGGLNCFGHSGEGNGYISVISKDGDWTGNGCGGLRQANRTVDMSAITGDYKLAIAYKTPANNAASATIEFVLYSTNATGPEIKKVVAGNTNGEWTLLEYNMSEFFNAGLDWTTPWASTVKEAWYTIGMVIQPTGQGLDVDAVLIYKPAE